MMAPEVQAADYLAVAIEKRETRNLPGDWGLPEIPSELDDLKMYFWEPGDALLGLRVDFHQAGIE